MIVLGAAFVLAAGLLAAVTLLGGCSANDPFDPNSVANRPPSIRFYVGPVDTTGELGSTSYFKRTFHWSGADPDGWVVEYYVSIDTSGGGAPWDTTTATDTTMTFTTDNDGNAAATIRVACRDDRGAVSDTVVQYIPLTNVTPVVNFTREYDPYKNMQREFIDADGNPTPDGSAAVDTIFFNWGDMRFDLIFQDPDGSETMDKFCRYTLADGYPDSTYDLGTPGADPEIHWIRQNLTVDDFNDEIWKTRIVVDALPSTEERTLTVSIKDEADADALFQYSWEVRAPKGRVLYFPDVSSSVTRKFYQDFLNAEYGEGNWDTYNFWFGGGGDIAFTLLESMRKFDLVLWTDSGTQSNNIIDASARGGVLQQYLTPTDGSKPGRMLLISRTLVGSQTKLSNPFLQQTLGVNPSADPQTALNLEIGHTALGLETYLPAVTSAKTAAGNGNGIKLYDQDSGTEVVFVTDNLYRMEECSRCYGSRPPFDPVIAVRSPRRVDSPLAHIVGISVQLDDFERDQAFAALAAILEFELGVGGP
jgi:hypothetical protein